MTEKVGALLLMCLGVASGREFTDVLGRKIKAEVQSVRAEKVVLVRADGKSFVFPITKLSEADRSYIKTWQEENPDIKLGYRFEKEKLSSSGNSTRKNETWRWKVTVENRGLSDIGELKFEYVIYKQVHDRYGKRKKYLSGKVGGNAVLSGIEAARSALVETKPIKTSKVNSVSSSSTVVTYEKWDESLVGIEMVVKFRDLIVDRQEFGIVPKE